MIFCCCHVELEVESLEVEFDISDVRVERLLDCEVEVVSLVDATALSE